MDPRNVIYAFGDVMLPKLANFVINRTNFRLIFPTTRNIVKFASHIVPDSLHIPFIDGIIIGNEIGLHSYNDMLSNVRGQGDAKSLSYIIRMDEGAPALYTGRMIVIIDPALSSALNIDNEDALRKWLESEGFESIERFLYNRDKDRSFPNPLLRALLHEYTHWQLVKETSMATYIEVCSWRARFDLMYLTEQIHRRTRLGRFFDSPRVGAEEALSQISAFDVKSIAADRICFESFRDSITHLGFLYDIYVEVLCPFVETITWAIEGCESSYDVLLERYFGSIDANSLHYIDPNLPHYLSDRYKLESARHFLSRSLEFLGEGNFSKRSIDNLIKISQKALDMPFSEIEESKSQGLNLLYKIRDRFNALIEMKGVRISGDRDKKFLNNIIFYMLDNRLELNRAISEMLSEKLSRNRDVLDAILEIVTTNIGVNVYQRPAVFVNFVIEGEVVTLRYDPFAEPITKRPIEVREYGRRFNDMADLVGYTPITHRTLMRLLYNYPEEEDVMDDARMMVRTFKHCSDGKESETEFMKIVQEILDLCKESDYKNPFESAMGASTNNFEKYLRIWLYYVLRMGKYALRLRGLHGIYT